MFGITYLYNKSCDLASWAHSFISPVATKTAKKVENVVQPEIRMGLLSRSWYWLNHWSPDIKRDYTEITDEWKDIRMSVNGFKNLDSSNLESKIALFLQRYSAIENGQFYFAISSLGKQITRAPTEIINGMTNSQVLIPGDGHCLFDAFAYAYLQLENTTQEICTYETFPREHLRKVVVEYEKKNYESDDILKMNLDESIREYKENTIKDFTDSISACVYDNTHAKTAKTLQQQQNAFEKLSDEQLREDYFKNMLQMTQRPLWGGQAELYALSKIFNITIHLEQGFTVSFNEGQAQSVTLVRVNNNHFNARL